MHALQEPAKKITAIKSESGPVVFMFSGQGSQYLHMATGLYQTQRFFRKIMEEGFALLENYTGQDYRTVLFPSTSDATANKKINETQFTQPLLFLVEYAMARLLLHWNIRPDYMIGHSIGEYAAACISGVFTFEDALQLVCKRGLLMSKVKNADFNVNNLVRKVRTGWRPQGVLRVSELELL